MELLREEHKETMKDIMGGAARLSVKIAEHGFVALVDAMPRLVPQGRAGDYAIVQAARTSYNQGCKSLEEDEKVLRYLMRHSHTSPFEFVEVKFHMSLPIFVARQFIRHRTASVNEQSGRYVELPDIFYVPVSADVRVQSKNNKQASEGQLEETSAQAFCARLEADSQIAYQHYREAIDSGVPREQARMLLPINLYTQWYWKCDLHNILNFLRLRRDSHAQKEIRDFADAMHFLLQPLFPATFVAWEDYVWNSLRLSRLEIEAVRIHTTTQDEKAIRAIFPNQREYDEWTAKRRTLFGK
jgi:thymidylate synthase (FAD)